MASKLSAKQKAILIEAYKLHQELGDEYDQPGKPPQLVLTQEILHSVYDWPYADWLWRGPVKGGQNFDRGEIGAKRYNADRASLSRTLTRLEQRGLIRIFHGTYALYAGFRLTDTGATIARQLAETVNTANLDA